MKDTGATQTNRVSKKRGRIQEGEGEGERHTGEAKGDENGRLVDR